MSSQVQSVVVSPTAPPHPPPPWKKNGARTRFWEFVTSKKPRLLYIYICDGFSNVCLTSAVTTSFITDVWVWWWQGWQAMMICLFECNRRTEMQSKHILQCYSICVFFVIVTCHMHQWHVHSETSTTNSTAYSFFLIATCNNLAHQKFNNSIQQCDTVFCKPFSRGLKVKISTRA